MAAVSRTSSRPGLRPRARPLWWKGWGAAMQAWRAMGCVCYAASCLGRFVGLFEALHRGPSLHPRPRQSIGSPSFVRSYEPPCTTNPKPVGPVGHPHRGEVCRAGAHLPPLLRYPPLRRRAVRVVPVFWGTRVVCVCVSVCRQSPTVLDCKGVHDRRGGGHRLLLSQTPPTHSFTKGMRASSTSSTPTSTSAPPRSGTVKALLHVW